MALVNFEEAMPKVGLITLNDPDKLNAMGEDMAREFSAVVQRLKAANLRALIITGAGRAFSAGGDLDMLERKQKLSKAENIAKMLEFYNSFLCVLELEIPLIAAINGHAIGAGLCLAAACDIRIASEKAKLGLTFTKLGLHPGMGATYTFPRLLGVARATELMTTGRVIDATEGERIGLISQRVKDSEVMSVARSAASEILTSGPLSVIQLVESLRTGPRGLKESLQREAECQSVNYASAEFAEGLAATREKRPGKF